MDIVPRPIIGDFLPENYQNLVISGQNWPYIGNSCQNVSILGNKIIFLNQYLQELVKSPRFGKLNLHKINLAKSLIILARIRICKNWKEYFL